MHVTKTVAPGIVMMIISLILLSQAYMMEGQSITDPAGGSFLPAIIACIMLISGIVTLSKGVWSTRNSSPHSSKESQSSESFNKKDYQIVLTFFCLVVGYILILPFLTFFPATFLFLAGSMFFLKGISWRSNLIVSTFSILVIYIVFSQLFNIVFP